MVSRAVAGVGCVARVVCAAHLARVGARAGHVGRALCVVAGVVGVSVVGGMLAHR